MAVLNKHQELLPSLDTESLPESQKKEVLGQFLEKLATAGKLQMGCNPHFCPTIFCGLIVELPPYTRTNNPPVSAGRKASQFSGHKKAIAIPGRERINNQ